MAIPVKLPVFEGPLDLLMHLIEKNKIDIYDIPIVEITDQYLEYVHQMDHEDMDVTSEFLVMAATLLDIKSRMLLPREKDEETGEEEGDPREELVRRLLEYKMYKYMSEELAVCREQAGVRYFRAQDLPKEVRSYQPPIDYEDLLKDTDLKRLETVFGEVLRRKKSRRDPIRSGFGKIKREEVNIDTKTLYIRAYLQAHPQTDFRALLESQESKEEVIVTFLILLELMKHQKVRIIQDSICGKILIESSETEENISSPLPEALETASVEDIPAEAPEADGEDDIPAEVPETDGGEDNQAEVFAADTIEDMPAEAPEEEEFVPGEISDGQIGDNSPAEASAEEFSGIRSLSIHSRIEVVSPVFPIDPDLSLADLTNCSGAEALGEKPGEAVSLMESAAEIRVSGFMDDPVEEDPAPETVNLPVDEHSPETVDLPVDEHSPETEELPVDVTPLEDSSGLHFSAHLWYGKMPGHVSPLCEFRRGAACASRFGRQASSCRLRRANPVWEQARLSRLWARRL